MRHAVWVVFALAACHGATADKASNKDVDLDTAMRKTLEPWPVDSIRCPADHGIAPGAKFDCQVTFQGGLVDPAHVEILANKVSVKLERAVMLGTDLAAALAKEKSAQFSHAVEVDCGHDVVASLGAVCKLTDAGTPAGLLRVQAKGGEAVNMAADSVAAEQLLRLGEEKALGPVDSVTCTPAGELKVGGSLACDLRMTGGAQTIARYTLGPDDAADGVFKFDQPLINLDQLAGDLSKSASKGQTTVAVDCGKGVVAQGPDGVVCSYAAGTEHGKLRATLGPDGHIRTEELP
jgi:hypothetical protein